MVSLDLSVPALVLAFAITVTEMTEVVALVFAVSSEADRLRTGAAGAAAGTGVVAAIALVSGAALERIPSIYLLGAASVVLAGFGVFLFRGTLKSYRRARSASTGAPSAAAPHALHFASGFSVGVVESTEAVIVLLALAAGGAGSSALVGALVGGGILLVAAVLVKERIRRIKVPQLKLFGTAMLFSFSVFWGGEALGVAWPGVYDLVLVPMVVVAALVVRAAIGLIMSRDVPVQPKG